jgi:hypothetical protein
VADWEGDELHASPLFLECREEGSVLRGYGLEFGVASEISTVSDFDDDEVAELRVEGGRVRGGGVGYPPGIDQVRRCTMSDGV